MRKFRTPWEKKKLYIRKDACKNGFPTSKDLYDWDGPCDPVMDRKRFDQTRIDEALFEFENPEVIREEDKEFKFSPWLD